MAKKSQKSKPAKKSRVDINWQIFRIMAEFVDGFQFLSGLKKEVTIFGSAKMDRSSRYYEEARKLAYTLGRADYTVITGGGPGIMEAGNRGAFEAGATSVGLNIQLPFEQRVNQYVTKAIGFYFFFTRKVMLVTSAQAYVFFPGGFGTMDELFDVMTLIETRKMRAAPVILVGREFWQPLIAWIEDKMLKKYHTIVEDNLKIFSLVDSAKEAFDIIEKTKDGEDFSEFV